MRGQSLLAAAAIAGLVAASPARRGGDSTSCTDDKHTPTVAPHHPVYKTHRKRPDHIPTKDCTDSTTMKRAKTTSCTESKTTTKKPATTTSCTESKKTTTTKQPSTTTSCTTSAATKKSFTTTSCITSATTKKSSTTTSCTTTTSKPSTTSTTSCTTTTPTTTPTTTTTSCTTTTPTPSTTTSCTTTTTASTTSCTSTTSIIVTTTPPPTTTYQSTTGTTTTSSTTACITHPEAGTYCGFINPDDPCAPQPKGYGPVPSPDTVSAFMSYSAYHAEASAAPTVVSANPASTYTKSFTDLNGSIQSNGYLGLYNLESYNATQCAEKCDGTAHCGAFNLYIERDPSLNPSANDTTAPTVWGRWCPDPASTINYKCALWEGPIEGSQATNTGDWREKFQVVITGSDGYNMVM